VARAGLALTGVGGRPFDAAGLARDTLAGERPTPERIEALAARVGQAVEPDSDVHAPAEYRKHLASVLTRRALLAAAERAGQRGRG